MPPLKIKLTPNQKRLIRRYLIWCYKTTKEELDRIDRYFTQLKADQFFLNELEKKSGNTEYMSKVNDFRKYMSVKEEKVLKQKFTNVKKNILNSDYQYLESRFQAVEKAIIYFLGKKELKAVTDLYEQEMTRRILEAREH